MRAFDFHTHQKKEADCIQNVILGQRIPETGYFSLGFHPWYLKQNWQEAFQTILELESEPRLLAIGEAGFDRIKGPEIIIQKEAFEAQANLAYEWGIPLILHCVKGHDLLVEFLKNNSKSPQIIWHGWNLKPRLAKQLEDFPVSFSFGKAILEEDSNAQNWLKACPKHKIFLETDDSELEIDSIYESASLILGFSVEDLMALTEENWNRIARKNLK